MLRVSVTVPDAGELERVVQVPAPLQERADRAAEQVLEALRAEDLLDNKDVSLAVLALLVRRLLAEEERPSP
jgi:hypothetical protein